MVIGMANVSCATTPTPQARMASSLNRNVRSPNARVSFIEEIPFGEHMRVNRWRLGNGLEVLILIDRSAPVLSYQTWFKVGSRNEHEGKTGLAHLFEHLMFNETEHLAAGEFDRLLETAGGETNAATWVDWTYYYENLPKAELPLAVRLEADRMANLVLRDRQVASEKEVVANERRYRVDDDVQGAVNERLYSTAFRRHPYHWPTIGWMPDIQGFNIQDCRAFYRTYYAPNNATLVIAGDVDEAATLRLVQRHYGRLSASRIPRRRIVAEPLQRAERRVTMHQPTPTEKLQLGFRSPGFGDYDWAVLTVANEVLFGGRSSRLYRRLVSEGELAAEVSGSVAPFRDPGLIEIWASAREGHTAAQMLAAIEGELRRLAREPVPAEELQKAKNRLELGFLQGLETASGKAEQIGFYETVLGDPSRVFSRLEEYRRVTAAEVQAAAARYLDVRRRTTIVVLPAEDGEAEAAE